MDKRYDATQHASNMLVTGLLRIPCATHSFVQYLWQTLVAPVAVYGVELFTWDQEDIARFRALQIKIWRRLLQLGARAPNDITETLMDVCSPTLEWRVQRVSLLLRLLHSSPESWQHTALVFFVSTSCDWFCEALEDLRLVLPSTTLRVNHAASTPYVHSDEEQLLDRQVRLAQLFDHCSQDPPSVQDCSQDPLRRKAQSRIRELTKTLHTILKKNAQVHLETKILQEASASPFSKSFPIATTLRRSSIPMSSAPDFIESRSHAAAVAAFFSGDFFLGRYAGNYFAKTLLPSSRRHLTRMASMSLDAKRVCLHCWHVLRLAHLEDESHAVAQCPLYHVQRMELLNEITNDVRQAWHGTASPDEKKHVLLNGTSKQDWVAMARYLARVWQVRRRMRLAMQRRCDLISKHRFQVV